MNSSSLNTWMGGVRLTETGNPAGQVHLRVKNPRFSLGHVKRLGKHRSVLSEESRSCDCTMVAKYRELEGKPK